MKLNGSAIGSASLSKVDMLNILYALDHQLPDSFDWTTKVSLEELALAVTDLDEDFEINISF